MRAFALVPVILAVTLGTHSAGAAPRVIQVDPAAAGAPQPGTEANLKNYRGYIYDLSDYAGRKDEAALEDNVKHQLDMVENAGFSPKVLAFFHSIPIVAAENDCLQEAAAIACYQRVAPNRSRRSAVSLTIWDHDKQQWTNPNVVDLAADSGLGVIALRPAMARYTEEPVLLHELMHAYHARLMPAGFDNKGIKAYYATAKAKNMLEKDSYTLKNDREFFAVTATIFLADKSIHEPKTRAALKEKMPDYYKYLVDVFGFDPEPAKTPVASSAPIDSGPTADVSPSSGSVPN